MFSPWARLSVATVCLSEYGLVSSKPVRPTKQSHSFLKVLYDLVPTSSATTGRPSSDLIPISRSLSPFSSKHSSTVSAVQRSRGTVLREELDFVYSSTSPLSRRTAPVMRAEGVPRRHSPLGRTPSISSDLMPLEKSSSASTLKEHRGSVLVLL